MSAEGEPEPGDLVQFMDPMEWLATLNRLSTGDMIMKWNSQLPSSCVFCNDSLETRDHLFFQCKYSDEVWKGLTQRLLSTNSTNNWSTILQLLLDNSRIKFWCEKKLRNTHPPAQLILMVDKRVRNRFLSFHGMRGHAYEMGMSKWLATR
ncbi:hypothetical protein YC2023_094607 [Brassica napus]